MRRARFHGWWSTKGTEVRRGGCRTDRADPCRCRSAVERCYRGLCGGGQPENHAFEAALTVYRWYHPEVPLLEAEATVRTWVIGGALH